MYMQRKRTVIGLTLIELMVTIAVLAILAAIGYPMYVEQVQKSRRTDARSAVMELAMAQEREFAAFGHFSEPSALPAGVSNDDGIPVPDAGSVLNADVARIADQYSAFYTFNITATTGTFTITATPAGRQVGDTACGSISIDQTGEKFATDADLCW